MEAAISKLTDKNPDLHKESAATIVMRSLMKVRGKPSVTWSILTSPDGFSFSHDPKLLGGTMRPWDESEVESFLRRIKCPVLIFWTKNTLEKFARKFFIIN